MASVAQAPDIDLKQGIVRKPRSPLQDAWLILLQNKVAVASGIFLILVMLAAIFAPIIAPEGIDADLEDIFYNNAARLITGAGGTV